MSNTYYVKEGKRYIPVGISGPDLYEGIWLVQVEPGRISHKNLICRIADLPDSFDLQVLAKVTMLEDVILKVMQDSWKDGGSASLAEVASRIASALATRETKLTTRKLRGS